MNTPSDDNPFQSPEATAAPDEERYYQLWEASFEDCNLVAKFFMNGQLKVYINDELVYDENKRTLKELVSVTYRNHVVEMTIKSGLRLRAELSVNDQQVEISKKLDHAPNQPQGPENSKYVHPIVLAISTAVYIAAKLI